MLLAIIVVAVFFIDVVELMLGVQKSVLEVANSVRDKKKIDSNVSDIRNDLSNVMDDDQLDTIDRKLAELQYMNSDD